MDNEPQYSPNKEAVEIIRTTPIVLLVGITAAGKDTIQARIIASDDYHEIITHTTRPPRRNNGVMEVDGKSYHFVSVEKMQQMIADKELVEFNEFNGKYYGTSVGEFRKAKSAGKIAVGDIDVNGISAFRSIAQENVTAIFIVPPDYETWRTRLEKRYSTKEELEQELPGRANTAIDELGHALSVPYYHFIINDDLDRAVRVVDEIAHRSEAFNRHDDEARLRAWDLLDAIKASI